MPEQLLAGRLASCCGSHRPPSARHAPPWPLYHRALAEFRARCHARRPRTLYLDSASLQPLNALPSRCRKQQRPRIGPMPPPEPQPTSQHTSSHPQDASQQPSLQPQDTSQQASLHPQEASQQTSSQQQEASGQPQLAQLEPYIWPPQPLPQPRMVPQQPMLDALTRAKIRKTMCRADMVVYPLLFCLIAEWLFPAWKSRRRSSW